MTAGQRIWAFARGLGSLGLLGLLLIGPPAMLVALVGWPLPTAVPAVDDVERAFSIGIDDAVVVKTLAVLAWAVWLQIALAFVAEVVATFRGRAVRTRSFLPGLQVAIGRLVSGATLVATSFASVHPAGAASPAPEPVAQLLPQRSPAAEELAAIPGGPMSSGVVSQLPASANVDADGDRATLEVRRHDSWWAIAEQTLGDGLRWRELRDLNVGRTMPDGHVVSAGSDLLRPGWQIVLPADAAYERGEVGSVGQESNGTTSPGGGDRTATGRSGESTEVTAAAGDSMWVLAERHMVDILGRPVSGSGLAGYWATVVEANRDRYPDPANPDLIHVGQRFVLPPVPGSLTTPSPSPDDGSPRRSAPAIESEAPEQPPDAATPADAMPTPPEAPESAATEGQREPSSAAATPSPPAPSADPEVSPAGSTARADTAMDDGDTDTSPISTPLVVGGASTLLAVGVIRAIRRGRRRRHHVVASADAPRSRDTALHRQLVVAADEDQIDTLGRALNGLAAGIADTGLPCRPLVVQHDADHLDVLLDHPSGAAVTGWRAQANGEVWTADPEALALDATAAAGGAATPLLVTVGEPDDGGQLYLDLEAARLVTLTGDRASACSVATTMATELAHSPLAANAQVIVVGSDLGVERMGKFDRVQLCDGWDEVADDLASWNDQSRDALAENEWPNTFAARGHDADHDALIPMVVIATDQPADIDLLGVLTAGPAATAVVIVGDALPGALGIGCGPDQLEIPQLGLTCRALALPPDDLDGVADLLADAAVGVGEQLNLRLDQEPVEMPSDDQAAPAADVAPAHPADRGEVAEVGDRYADPEYEILVRLLGDITVEGGTAALTGKQTALVAYIALHQNVSSDRVADAVWVTPAAVSERKRLANTITKCRAAIGARHLPVAKDSRYTVGPDVVTDLDLFEQRVAAASGDRPPEQEVRLLDSALDLVRGPVFDYPGTERDSYSWVDVENWISRWELKVAATAERAAELHLELGEPAEAAEIAERSLRAVPTHPGLTEILMRAHAANGDRLAVQRVYQAHVNALEQLDLDTVAESTAALYERLRAG